MSSPEWRDCGGHFFFLGEMLRQSQGGEDLVKQMNGMGFMAMYASEEKAKAERKAGQTKDGLGESAADPKTGQLQVKLKSMIDAHAAKSRAYADNAAYVQGVCGEVRRADGGLRQAVRRVDEEKIEDAVRADRRSQATCDDGWRKKKPDTRRDPHFLG